MGTNHGAWLIEKNLWHIYPSDFEILISKINGLNRRLDQILLVDILSLSRTVFYWIFQSLMGSEPRLVVFFPKPRLRGFKRSSVGLSGSEIFRQAIPYVPRVLGGSRCRLDRWIYGGGDKILWMQLSVRILLDRLPVKSCNFVQWGSNRQRMV